MKHQSHTHISIRHIQALAVAVALFCTPSYAQSIEGDFDGDCEVGFSDFLAFAGVFGQGGESIATYDLDGNASVDFGDFLIFAGQFGSTCEDAPTQPTVPTLEEMIGLLGPAAESAATAGMLEFGYEQSVAESVIRDTSHTVVSYGSRVKSPTTIQVATGLRSDGLFANSAQILKWRDNDWVNLGSAQFTDDGLTAVDDTEAAVGNTYTYASVLVDLDAASYVVSPLFSIDFDEASTRNLDKTRVVALLGTFSDTELDLTESDMDTAYQAVRDVFDEISYGQAQFEFDTIDLGRGNLSESAAIDLFWTLSTFFNAYLKTPDFRFGEPCDFDAIIPLAQQELAESLVDNFYGITIDTLSIAAARPFACEELGAGEVLMRSIGIPESVNLHRYDILVTVPYGDQLSDGAAASDALTSGISHGEGPITAILDYVYSPYGPGFARTLRYGHITESESPEERTQSDQYTEGQNDLTQFEQTLAHEIGHALGIQTHSNGIYFYTSQEDADALLTDPATQIPQQSLEYGNYFDLMGTSEYGVGMAPYYREFLGWLTPERIYDVTSSETVTINGINTATGIVTAKIAVTGGWIYVSYHPPTGYDQSLSIPELVANTQGAMITYVLDSGFSLSTSYLLDVSGPVSDLTFALQPGESFALYGVTIDNVRIEDTQLLFDVTM